MALYTIAGVVILSILLYKFFTRNFSYWKERNIPFVEPMPIFGNFFDVFTFRASIGHHLQKLYNTINERYFGVFIFNNPILILKDPEVIKQVLVKDFNYFNDRNMLSDEKCDPLTSQMLFVMKNPDWKVMRTKMTPVFTSGKIKSMFSLMNNASLELVNYLTKHQNEKFLEIKEITAKYSTDVIASCAFGIEAHSFECEDAQFRTVGRKMFDLNWKTGLRQTVNFIAPDVAKLFRVPFLDPSIAEFLRNAFWATIKGREAGNSKRNDLIDIIVNMNAQQNFKEAYAFEGDRVVAQAAQFFAAGFETVSSTMAFTLYELALQPQIQARLRNEIKTEIGENGVVTYEALQKMKYLHMVICETLRKYPVLPFLDRTCSKDYQIPGTKTIIEKGTAVYIPLFGLHFDAEYFPEPEKYDPERFSDENKSQVTSFSYIPFGDGPRNCIGERFGLIGTKLGLVRMLYEFEVQKCDETPVPMVFDPKTFLLASTVGIPVKMVKPVSVAA